MTANQVFNFLSGRLHQLSLSLYEAVPLYSLELNDTLSTWYIAKPVVHAVVKYTIYTAQYKKDWCVKRMEKSVHSWSPVICSDSKLLLQCWIEGPTVIKRDSVLEEPKHDQKQICVQGEHTHAQFTHMHMSGSGAVFFGIEAMI